MLIPGNLSIFGHFPDMDKKKKIKKKNYVALKNYNDDWIGEYVFIIHLFIYPLLLFNVTFNLITYLTYYMEHENRLKKRR